MPSTDYPRMMFHRNKEPVTVHSRDEEDALGPDWSRIIWAAAAPAAAPEPEPEQEPQEELDPEPEKEVSPAPPRRPAKPPISVPAAIKTAKRKR
jgi:hypothetical protein